MFKSALGYTVQNNETHRSDVNILNDTTCSKEESRTNGPPMLMSSSLSVTPSIYSIPCEKQQN